MSPAAFGLNKQIKPTAIAMEVRLSGSFFIHNEIKYIAIIIPARTLEGVKPATSTKNITKNVVSMYAILSFTLSIISNLNIKNVTIDI